MGCLFACLGPSNHRKSKKLPNPIPSDGQKHEAFQFPEPIKQEKIENPIISPTPESKEKVEEKLSSPSKRQVTSDLNVKTQEEIVLKEACDLVERNEEKVEENQKESGHTPRVQSHPPNHRYQNCRDSDSELEEDPELEVKDLDDNDNNDGGALIQIQESSESLFSLSIESRKQVSEAEKEDEKEINSPMPKPASKTGELKVNLRDRSENVDSVLNPVENLNPWKSMKARATPPVKHQAKENIEQDFNIIPISPEPSLKLLLHGRKPVSDRPNPVEETIGVDTSLSSWLVGLGTTPNSKTSTVSVGNSPASEEDGPILGALTVEDLKQMCPSSSPSRSPSRDEVPMIGTVGSYWSHTGQTMPSASTVKCLEVVLN